MAKGTKIETSVSSLKYVFITGAGSNQAMKGEEPRMQFVASVVMPKGSPAHKALEAAIDKEWEAYKTAFGVKGKPKTNGIKDEMMKDPSGEIDPDTEEVRRIPTGNVIATFKTNTHWPDGKDQIVKVYQHDGKDVTAAVRAASWTIGEGSTGIIHGTACGNNTGGTHKVTLYLTAIQLAKLVKYEGTDIQIQEIEGEDLDLGDAVTAIPTGDNAPNL